MATPLDRVQAFTVTKAGFTTLGDVGDPQVVNLQARRLVLEVHNSSANALTDFQVCVQAHAAADWQVLVNNTAWATTTKCVQAVVGTLQTLAGGAKGFAHVEVGPVYAVKIRASAGTAATITVRGQISD